MWDSLIPNLTLCIKECASAVNECVSMTPSCCFNSKMQFVSCASDEVYSWSLLTLTLHWFISWAEQENPNEVWSTCQSTCTQICIEFTWIGKCVHYFQLNITKTKVNGSNLFYSFGNTHGQKTVNSRHCCFQCICLLKTVLLNTTKLQLCLFSFVRLCSSHNLNGSWLKLVKRLHTNKTSYWNHYHICSLNY